MYWIQANGSVWRPIRVTLTAWPGLIRSSSTWMDTDGPAVGVDVGVAVAGPGVEGTAVGGGVTEPVPGSNALVRSEFGSSPGRATQDGEPGLYWARKRLACISCARSGGRLRLV